MPLNTRLSCVTSFAATDLYDANRDDGDFTILAYQDPTTERYHYYCGVSMIWIIYLNIYRKEEGQCRAVVTNNRNVHVGQLLKIVLNLTVQNSCMKPIVLPRCLGLELFTSPTEILLIPKIYSFPHSLQYIVLFREQRYRNIGNDIVMSLNVQNKYETKCDTTARFNSAGLSNGKQYIRFTMKYTQGTVNRNNAIVWWLCLSLNM